MKRMTAATAFALAIVLSAAGSAGPATDRARSIRLVYHSDTQGYYRPCG